MVFTVLQNVFAARVTVGLLGTWTGFVMFGLLGIDRCQMDMDGRPLRDDDAQIMMVLPLKVRVCSKFNVKCEH